MKKKLEFLLLILIVLNCFACEPATFYFDYEELKENVVKIELINYNNLDAKKINNEIEAIQYFDFSKMEIIETLPGDKLEAFLGELSAYGLLLGEYCLDSPKGICIRIVYQNGDFEVLGVKEEYGGTFEANGNLKRFIGGGVGYVISNRFFETQV